GTVGEAGGAQGTTVITDLLISMLGLFVWWVSMDGKSGVEDQNIEFLRRLYLSSDALIIENVCELFSLDSYWTRCCTLGDRLAVGLQIEFDRRHMYAHPVVPLTIELRTKSEDIVSVS
ncbi:4047_t:CDS:2, partial [Scutellospora calospora]